MDESELRNYRLLGLQHSLTQIDVRIQIGLIVGESIIVRSVDVHFGSRENCFDGISDRVELSGLKYVEIVENSQLPT